MDQSLSDVFERHCSHLKFDNKLASGLYKYQIHLATMSPDHIQFFGGNLLGVQVLRFLPKDVNRLYDQVLDIDYKLLEADIRKLTTIYHENSITGDILNLTLMYLIHRFYGTKHMVDSKKMRAAYDIALIFCYRCLFALTNNYFKYPVDPKVAQAVYANLSNKNLIKSLGTWKKLCDYRANKIIEKNGLNYERLVLFNDDMNITAIISDSQGRFKDVFRTYYSEFDRVHKDGESIASTSSTMQDVDGNEVLREKTKSVESYLTYARNIISDTDGFVKSDLVTVVADINSNTSFRMVRSTLTWMSEGYSNPKTSKLVDKFITDVIVQATYYIEYNVPITRRKDYPFILITLKNLFLSTRSVDVSLHSIRDQGEKIVTMSNKGVSSSLMMATRTAIILYVILRVLTGYQQR